MATRLNQPSGRRHFARVVWIFYNFYFLCKGGEQEFFASSGEHEGPGIHFGNIRKNDRRIRVFWAEKKVSSEAGIFQFPLFHGCRNRYRSSKSGRHASHGYLSPTPGALKHEPARRGVRTGHGLQTCARVVAGVMPVFALNADENHWDYF